MIKFRLSFTTMSSIYTYKNNPNKYPEMDCVPENGAKNVIA